MDQPAVGPETFVLKTYNIHSLSAEMELVKLLEDIPGVHRISIDPTEIGKITILGTIGPNRLIEILCNKGIRSEQVFEPRINLRDLPNNFPGPQPPGETFHVTIDEQVVEILEKLSKLNNLETVDLTRDGMRLKYKKDENIRHVDGETGSCSTLLDENAAHKNGDVMNICIGVPMPAAPDYTPTAPPMENDRVEFFVFFCIFLFVLVIQAVLA